MPIFGISFFIAGGLQGYLIGVGSLRGGPLGWLTRLPLVIGGILIGWPGMWTSVVGLLISLLVASVYLVINRRESRRRKDEIIPVG